MTAVQSMDESKKAPRDLGESVSCWKETMAESVFLVFGEEVGRERFVELVVSLGGVTGPDERGEARLSDGYAHVWVHLTGLIEDEPDELAVYQARLGGPVMAEIELEISRTKGSEQLAFRVVRAARACIGRVMSVEPGRSGCGGFGCGVGLRL